MKSHNLADWLAGKTHRTMTICFDDLLMDGHITQKERITLSSIIGDMLNVMNDRIIKDLPHYRQRGVFDFPAPEEPEPVTDFPIIAESILEVAQGLQEEGDIKGNKSVDLPVKFLNSKKDRVGGWLVLYGDENNLDLDNEYFSKSTEGLLDAFNVTGVLPYFYNHTVDTEIKSTPLGVIDTIKETDWGLWYEAQLQLADDYKNYVEDMISAGKLGTSSGAYSSSVARKGAFISHWTIAEGSATPTPSDPRQVSHPVELLKAITMPDEHPTSVEDTEDVRAYLDILDSLT